MKQLSVKTFAFSGKRHLVASSLAASLMCASANAAVLATYSVSGGSLTASGVNSIITTTPITNTGVAGGFGVSSGNSQILLRASDTGANTLANAVTEGDFVQFTITPTGANVVSLTSVSLDHFGSVNANAGAYSSSFSVFASIAGIPTFTAGNELGTSTVSVANSGSGTPGEACGGRFIHLGCCFPEPYQREYGDLPDLRIRQREQHGSDQPLQRRQDQRESRSRAFHRPSGRTRRAGASPPQTRVDSASGFPRMPVYHRHPFFVFCLLENPLYSLPVPGIFRHRRPEHRFHPRG